MIKLTNLHKQLGSQKVLTGLNLNIEEGTTCVIIGRSGCGKSVLLKHIVGLLKADKGEVFVDGLEVGSLNEKGLDDLRLKIGLVFQGGALFDSMNVGENVGFGLIERGNIPEKEILERINSSLAMVGLKGINHIMPSELSGGMRKRVALARAICIKPQIILYDEPTTGVDPITADAINDLIINMHDKLKVTSIVVTHDMRSAYKVADKIAMLYQGKIIDEGSSREIANSRNPIVHQFVNGLASGPITENLENSR
jgi:phospholipid/cholesterol/gamma-HCH transport system ATP-binding protein